MTQINEQIAQISELQKVASQVRRDILRMVHGVGSGHPGGALGCADLFVALYFKHMEHNKEFSMDGINEDLFFLSNGHISAVFYSTLARAGYFPVSELASHRKINSRLQGHPTPYEHLEGIRMASGSLGQGLSVAIGAAEAKKLNNDDKFVYCLMGDGEQQEGQVWEAAMYAPHNKLDNLIAFIDYNNAQIDGTTEEVCDLLDLGKKYEAFGWEVMHVDGNDMLALDECITKAKASRGNGKPVAVIMKTDMGHPIDFMVGTHKWHGVAPNDEQLENALSQLEETLGDY
ncbi:transketolase [Sediminitomix flava]|uniref:Transketolase n=1 Tax=Sediminitomix flava TaxID=379075 RepID=A0A315ZC36_SEDFL|nr:transketolase [Sediminitomix flava]PWJ42368.1 transketolase [Sediminitomix flava]